MNLQAFIHNLGDFLDALGGYLVVRFFVTDTEALRRTIKTLAIVCLIQGASMINERITHINVFGLLGGMPVTPLGSCNKETTSSPALGSMIPAKKLAHHSHRKE